MLRAQNFLRASSGIHSRSRFASTPIKIVGKINPTSHGIPTALSPSFTHWISEKPSNAKAINTANVTLCPRSAFQSQEVAEIGFTGTSKVPEHLVVKG